MTNYTTIDPVAVVYLNLDYGTGATISGSTYIPAFASNIDYRSPAARKQAEEQATFVTRMRRVFLDAEVIDLLAKGQPTAIAAPPGRIQCPLALRAGRLPLPVLKSQNVLAPLPRARRHERQSVPSRTRRRLRTWEHADVIRKKG